MWAAAEGRSNLGIPKSVGEEFVKADSAGKPEGGDLSDREAMEAIRDGELPSPTKYDNCWLFDLRITGTGMAYRDAIDEWAFRDPAKWTSPEFVERCNGLPVIFLHPEEGGLDGKKFREDTIGQIHLPYVKSTERGDEVWGVAKIYDEDAATLMQTTHTSTSPGVTPPKGSEPITLENGAKVLDEDLPLILDHLAVCEQGVWDKDGPPEGVRLDSADRKGNDVTEAERETLEKERDDARKELADAKARLDSMEKEREDARRKDAEEETEKAAIEREEKEKADKAKRDSRKDRHAKHDGDVMDCARCDSEEKEEHEKEDKKRKDASAPEENIDPNREEEIKDRKMHDSRVAELERQHAELQNRFKALQEAQAPLSHEDANSMSAAYHRADSIFQMLGERTPQPYPGEKPLAFRKRAANELRRHTKSFKDERIHDAAVGSVFDLVEAKIYEEALAEAKNPTIKDSVGILRPVVDTTTMPGKTITRFFGDARVAFDPFMPQRRLSITRFVRPNPQQGVNV